VLDNLRADAARLRAGRGRLYWLEALLLDNGFQAVVCYRLARWFKVRRIPFFGPATARFGLFLTGADLSPGAEIGPGLRISHGVGLVVGGCVKIGAGALLLHGVTLGAPSEERWREMPTLGDRVFVGAGAAVLGAVTVGDGAVIAAGAVVTRDVPAGATVVSTARAEILPSAAGGEPRRA
jgi:serine O-acetyltransferase